MNDVNSLSLQPAYDFTLVEVAMVLAVSTIIFSGLMEMVEMTQSLSQSSAAKISVQQRAEMTFQTIENDLSQSVASDIETQRIPFYIEDSDAQLPTFIATSGQTSTTYFSTYIQVCYDVGSVKKCGRTIKRVDNISKSEQFFKRKTVRFKNNDLWNFYNATGNSWVKINGGHSTGFRGVTDGVSVEKGERVTFRFYQYINKEGGGKVSAYMKPGIYYHLPAFVDVKLTLYDASFGYSDKYKQTFVKRISLPQVLD